MVDPEDVVQAAPAQWQSLLGALGIQFHDLELLALALRHPSVSHESGGDPNDSNQRLEFLGDAVIELAVSAHLFAAMPESDEGELTTTRSFVVRGSALAQAARRIGLDQALALGPSAAAGGGRGRRSVLAAGLEAVIGAVYLDQGWEVAREVAGRILAEGIAAAAAKQERNYKGELQEILQAGGQAPPNYRLVTADGPSHQPEFMVVAECEGRELGRGRGRSKKEAEQAAARAALESGDLATSAG